MQTSTVKRGPQEWAAVVAQWEASGQTYASFARQHGVSESALRWWRGELGRRARGGNAIRGTAPNERPLAVAKVIREGQAEPAGPISVQVGRAQIWVRRGFDSQLLRDVVRALQEVE